MAAGTASRSHVFPRFRGVNPIRAERGDGAYVVDDQGRRYLDACGGAAISCLGHSEQRVVRALTEQAGKLAFAHPMFYTSGPAEQLAANLVADAPGNLRTVFFGCGGSEQVDGALKLARQYFVDIGQPRRTQFIARRQGFHGNTLGSLGLGGHVARREPYLPILASGLHVSPCYAYRHQSRDETESDYADRLARELEATIQQAGPETVIAFVAETVVGAALGAVPPVSGYFRRVREICDRYGILLILDEVMCGMGRCGSRYACEQEGIAPDILVVAKGLGSGYQPISAALVSEDIVAAVMQGRGYFQHGHSYMAHPVACAAALRVQQVIREDRLLENVVQMGKRLQQGLIERLGSHPSVGDIRGRGLLWGVELVKDRDSRQPFDPRHALWLKVLLAGMGNGLMCYPSPGTSDGVAGDHILLAPTFNVTAEEINLIVEKLAHTLNEALDAIEVPIERYLQSSVQGES